MKKRLFTIFLVHLLIILFVVYLGSNSLLFSDTNSISNEKDEFYKGVAFYYQQDYQQSIIQFTKVLSLTEDKTILVDTYFYLSLCYLYLGDVNTTKKLIKKMLLIDPSRDVSDVVPPEYRSIFSKVKANTSEEKRVIDAEKEKSFQVLPPPPPPSDSYVSTVSKDKKRRKPGLLIVGGVVLAGGAVAALILLSERYGMIDVSSTPAGASIFLDGTDTGQITPTIIEDVEPGAHDVGVRLDGYVNFSKGVNVEKKQTATVNANLTAHTITVTNPVAGDVWVKGRNYNVNWTVGGSGQVNVLLQPQGNIENPLSPSLRLVATRSHYIKNRRIGNNGIQINKDSKLNFGTKEYWTHNLYSNQNHNQHERRNPGIKALSQFKLRQPGDFRPMDIANMIIEVLRNNVVVATLASSTPNDRSQIVTAPTGVANAANFVLRVASAFSENVFGLSPEFWISFVGSIQCNSNPTDANIILDGIDTGFNTNKKINDIPVGNHTIKYERDRFFDSTTTNYVAKNAVSNVNKLLDPSGFYEDFNNNTAEFWKKKHGSGSWFVSGGTYRMRYGSSTRLQSCHYDAGSGRFPFNCAYEVWGKNSIGPSLNAWALAFGGNDNFSQYYIFNISPGYRWWSIFKITGPNSWINIRPWTYSSALYQTGWNKVKVEKNGNAFYFYINDSFIYSLFIYNVPSANEIGLWSWPSSYNDETSFDNVHMMIITSPSKENKKNKSDQKDSSIDGHRVDYPAIPRIIKRKK